MTNAEAAQCLAENAMAYGRSGDMETVMRNLEEIARLLQAPDDGSVDYSWEDFK